VEVDFYIVVLCKYTASFNDVLRPRCQWMHRDVHTRNNFVFRNQITNITLV
jgi:hypothetical protein